MLTVDFLNKKIIFAGNTVQEQEINRRNFIEENELEYINAFIHSPLCNEMDWQAKQDRLELCKKNIHTEDYNIIESALMDFACNSKWQLNVPDMNDRLYIYTYEVDKQSEDGNWLETWVASEMSDLLVECLLRDRYINITDVTNA